MWRAVLLAAVASCGHSADSADAPSSDAAATDAPLPPLTSVTTSQLCKLLSNRFAGDPTANDVQHRANMLGADLGIPVAHGDQLFLMFGDTIGFNTIWPPQESHPDAVGAGGDTATAIAAQPNLLCTDLGILHLSSTLSTDGSVQADFAGGAMAAPTGHDLGEYIHNPAGGTTTFPYLPGDFEVPSGAFASGDSIYIFYTTVVSRAQPNMVASYLARWQNPSATGMPSYQILYAVDALADGALHGHFINVAAEVSGDYVYLFGTGAYRASPIYIARKRLDALATPGGFEELGTVTTTPGYGETSVRYFPEVHRWMVLAEELLPASNRIVAYTAADPAGPWTGPLVVHDMADAQFRASYCCTTDDDCENEQMFNCDRTGFYGSYLLPGASTNGASFTVAYTLSSFSPYNVALFEATFTAATRR
jgi:hypothetical protein